MKSFVYILLLIPSFLSAQDCGEIKGVIYIEDSTDVIPFAKVILYSSQDTVGILSDIYGKYKFSNLKEGVYDIDVISIFSIKQRVKNIDIQKNKSVDFDFYLINKDMICNGGCSTICRPYFYFGNESVVTVKNEDIKIVASHNPVSKTLNSSSDFKMINTNLFVRGTRANNVGYYIDGVKVNSDFGLPRTSVKTISYYLGGIPAKYGDTTSGIITINTTSYFDLYYEWKAKQ